MWGLFIGLALGALQVVGISIFGKMVLGDNVSAKLIGAFLLMVKIAVIVLVLILIANISLTHLVWTVAGMLAGLILTLTIMQARRRKKAAASGHTDGKDSNDG